MQKRGKKSVQFRNVVVGITLIYMVAVAGLTMYSQYIYTESLPFVTLGKAEDGQLPVECFQKTQVGYALSTVEQSDGPWGKRYLIKQISVFCIPTADGNNMELLDEKDCRTPVVVATDAENLYSGMEVRIR